MASTRGEIASHSILTSMFGSLHAAFDATGFTERPRNARRHSDKEIMAAISALEQELGRFPGFHDLEAASAAGKCPSPGTIVRRLGPLTKLRKSSGDDSVKRYTDEELVSAIKRMTKELGRFPNYRDLVAASAAGRGPSVSVVRKRLGRLSEIKARFPSGPDI